MPALPIIAIAATVAATAVAAGSAYAQGQAQKKAADYNAQMEQYNAEIQARQGQEDAANIESQGEIIQGKARAAAAASGLSGGSSLDIQYNDLVKNDQDALAAKYRGTIGAYNATSQSTLDSMNASNAQTQGLLGTGGALLSGAGKVYTQTGGNAPTPNPIFGTTTTENSPGF